jgi:outer membrane protein TolC
MTAARRCTATVVLGGALWLTVLWPAPRAHASEKLLTLSEAFRLALRNNESFGITEEGVRRVRLAYDKALALLLPTLRVEGTYTFYDTELAFDFGNRRVVLQQKSQFGGLGTFTMSLFDARALPGLRQTKIQAKASEESTAFTQADLLFEVSRTFVSVLAAQRLVEVNRNAVIVAEEHLRDARAQAKAGTALRLAVTRAEIEVVKAQREHTRAQNGLEAAWVALRYLVGAPVRGALARPVPPSLGSRAVAELVVEAQRSRRDLRAAAREIESARKGLDVAYGSFYPSLGLLASSRATPATGLANRVLNSQTVFTLGWTIFDGGVRYAELKEKHSLLREATLKHQQLTRQIEREVRTARLELDTAEAALVTSRRELDLARENHGMVMARFRAGLATTIEAVDASTQLATAEVSVLREELNVDTMRINLLRATGVDPLAALNGGENPAPKSALRVPKWDASGAAGERSSR